MQHTNLELQYVRININDHAKNCKQSTRMSDELVESGATVFAPPPSPTYRYVISCKADQLSISLEDQKSKQQWATGYLPEDSYLTSSNRIGNAAVADYVSIFKEALDYLVTTDRKSDLNTKKTRRNLILMDAEGCSSSFP
ncbi:hypothetical protein PF001_g30373 [Phytophthora fragariae]|uniref:Uncharacterized protein n=3 Tax=Phytophthora fragariae TaxID=53985 RepID=A0A6A4B5K7_9STRA|nr:hypothetical protein PF001_g30373 [Phytophthora fragariae]